jgi:hypothetical protein
VLLCLGNVPNNFILTLSFLSLLETAHVLRTPTKIFFFVDVLCVRSSQLVCRFYAKLFVSTPGPRPRLNSLPLLYIYTLPSTHISFNCLTAFVTSLMLNSLPLLYIYTLPSTHISSDLLTTLVSTCYYLLLPS